jgi:Tol biopolymer transport system component
MKFHSVVTALAAGVLFGSLYPSAASAQYFGRNKIQYTDYEWHVLSTPHFDIHYYNGAEEFAVRAGLVLEDGYDEYTYKLKEVLPWKVPVILYSNHADFLETNVTTSQLSEGVQAFAEPSRKRIVLPFTSSFKEFQHTAVHELAHVFTFNIVYNRMLDNVFTRNYLFPMPLWVAEGLAEYLAEGWDADADMFIRDAVIHDYLYPFYMISGFYVYKEGQSVFNYIADTYGHEKVLEILDALAGTRSAEAALERTLGLSEEELYEQWAKALRKHYWPLYPDKQEVGDVGRRLTDHVADHAYYNTKPVLSPDGELIVFFSDQDDMVKVRVISALDGREVANVVTGSRTNKYESLHLLTSSVSFDPSGQRVAFVALSKGHDALFVRNIKTGEERQYEIASNGLTAPAFHPTREEVVLSATFHGQTDLMLVDLNDGTTRRLTDDPADQLTPRFYPDGNKIVFVYYPEVTIPVPANLDGENRTALSEMDFLNPNNVRTGASYDIYEYDLATGAQRALVESPGDDTEPLILADNKTMIYASDESGVNNLHAGNVDTRETYRFTDVLGGLFTPSVHEEKGRIAFSGFVKGGWDIYVSDDLPAMMARRYSEPTRRVLAHDPAIASKDLKSAEDAAKPAEELAQAADTTASDATGSAPADSADASAPTKAVADSASASSPLADDLPEPQIRPLDGPKPEPAQTSSGNPPPIPGVNTPIGIDEPVFRGATVKPYHSKLAPDFIGSGGGLYFSSGFGFGLSNSIALSDMLGDHHLVFAFNLTQDIAHADLLAAYTYLKRRVDFSVGAYQLSGYYDSRVTSVGETFSSYRTFSERNYGIFGMMSVPFNKFYRMDVDLQAYYSDREFFQDVDPTVGFRYTTVEESKVRLIEPSLAFVHDSSIFGPFGPVDGSRWRVSLARGVAFEDQDISRTTGYIDWRWYRTLFWRNSLAMRFSAAASTGEDPRIFFVGGPTRLRGYDYDQISGPRMWFGSLEYRFPLLDAIIFGWPGRWGLTNIGATAFFDIGSAWYRGTPDLFEDDRLDEAFSDVGFGLYMYAGYFLTSFQFAWPTDLNSFDQDMKFIFFMGPTF